MILVETGDFLMTESGDFLIQENYVDDDGSGGNYVGGNRGAFPTIVTTSPQNGPGYDVDVPYNEQFDNNLRGHNPQPQTTENKPKVPEKPYQQFPGVRGGGYYPR